MPIAALSDILWYWDAIAGPQPIVGGEPTFSRSSSGLVIPDRAFRVRSLAADYPRFPWVTVGGDRLPAMLLEMARTNRALQSQSFDNGTWGKSRASVSANAIVAPDGTLTADKIVEDTATGVHIAFQSVTITDGGSHAVSIFARAAGRDWILLRSVDGGIGFQAFFDLANGAVGTLQTVGSGATATRASIEDIGNGWYRCTIVGKKQAGDTTTDFQVGPATGDLGSSYTGDGSSGVYVWGAQFEDNVAAATSYVGETTTSAVARAVESMSWNAAPAPQAMVIYLDLALVDPLAGASGQRFLHIGAGAGSDARLFVSNVSANTIQLGYDPGTLTTATRTLTGPAAGDRVQIVAVLNADGSGRLIVSHNAAAVDAAAMSAAAEGLASAWSEDTIWLGSTGGLTGIGAQKYRQLKIVKPGNLDAAVDGTADQALLDELAALTVNQFGSVRT